MPEIVRSRDCVIFFMGDTQTVVVSQAMVNSGWTGGQGVQWVDSNIDERIVTYSSGLYGGFMLWGSDETSDKLTAMTKQQPEYQYAVMVSGGALMSTISYERYTYHSRTFGGPLVPLIYTPNAILYLSRRGYWTLEDEMTPAGDPRAPAFFTGFVAQVPKENNNFYLGVQTSM